tara:strand:- start:396 stop:737 length:342 start_codon:yes stop_codon:yes gene_type:complete
MEKIKLYQFLEYSTITLILSYFIFHNIFLVLTGIAFSLYLINIKDINSLDRSINKKIVIKNESKESNKNDKAIKSNYINAKKSKEDRQLTLVDEIEELGYIPSISKNNDSNAA